MYLFESLLCKNTVEMQKQMFSIDYKQFVISKENMKVYFDGFKLSNLRTPAGTLTNSRRLNFPLEKPESSVLYKPFIQSCKRTLDRSPSSSKNIFFSESSLIFQGNAQLRITTFSQLDSTSLARGPKLFPPHFRRLHPLTINAQCLKITKMSHSGLRAK